MGKGSGVQTLEPRIAALAADMGFELVELCVDKEPAGRFLRFYIDRPEGISLDDCERFHKAVRPLVELIDFDYMEVSSPGADRPLKKDRDFERALGSEVEVRLFRPIDSSKTLQGILSGFDREQIQLETAGGTVEVPRKAVALARLTVDMERIEEVDLSGGEDDQETETDEEE